MNNKMMPALIGGALIGVLCAILGNIPFVNFCCCLVGIAGGVLAVMLYVKNAPTPMTMGEGAMLGAMAGAIGGAIYFVLTAIIGLIIGAAFYEAQMRQLGSDVPFSGITLVIIGALIGGILLAILATIGGVIGVPIFEKRKGGDVPPAPPTYGGDQPAGGGYSGGGGGGGSFGTGA
jgi:hypothetical protein